MKKVKLLYNKGNHYAQNITSERTGLSFAWMGKSDKNGEFRSLSGLAYCREIFISSLWRRIIQVEESYNHLFYNSKISMNEIIPGTRVRVMVRCVSQKNTDPDEFPTRAKRVLNIFEKYLGWRPTTISKSEDDIGHLIFNEYRKKIQAHEYLFEFSKKWVRSPELLSFYFLIVKLCQFNMWDNFNNLTDLPNVASKAKVIPTHEGELKRCFVKTYKFWLPVLDRVDELFMRQSTLKNFEFYDNTYGFHRFVFGQGLRYVAAKKWDKIRKELKELEGKTT